MSTSQVPSGHSTCGIWTTPVAWAQHPSELVGFNGPPIDDPATVALSRAILERLPASAVLSLIPADGADKELLAIAPALGGKKSVAGVATAYVCEFGVCQAPTTDPRQMHEQILRGWRK